MNTLWEFLFSPTGQQVGIFAYLLVVLANTIANVLSMRRLETAPPPNTHPTVAVLIPARNEANTIERCVRSLLAQTYPHAHVYVLDDHSTDATPDIVRTLARNTNRLTLLHGEPLPPGWLGKPWACWQLAHATTADILVFVDADTWHAPTMLEHMVAALAESQAHLLSALPRQETVTLAEKLSVPIIPWSLLTHFPLALAQRYRLPLGAAAVGQVLAMPRSAYMQIGGHAAVRQEVAEDMALARHVARLGLRWALWNGTADASCRMYRSARGVWEGFGKNLFAVFGQRLLVYLFIWLWLALVFISPWVMLGVAWAFEAHLSISMALANIACAALLWFITARQLRLHTSVVWLFPLIHATSTLIAFHSLGQTLTHRATWKGRPVYTVPQKTSAEQKHGRT